MNENDIQIQMDQMKSQKMKVEDEENGTRMLNPILVSHQKSKFSKAPKTTPERPTACLGRLPVLRHTTQPGESKIPRKQRHHHWTAFSASC